MDVSFKNRLLTALIGVPLIILLLLSPTWVVTGAVMASSIVGLYEFFNAVGLKDKKLLCLMGYLAALVIPIGGSLMPSDMLLLIYIFIVIVFGIMLASHKSITLTHIALLLMGLLYIPYFLSHITYIRELEFGNFYIWLVFIGAFMTDSCAFFAGKALGKHKLCPNISPKKTIEGAIGGVLGCGLSFMLFGLIVNTFFSQFLNGMHIGYVRLFVLGLLIAAVSQIGDLVASLIKRQFNIKDFGNILPGHGGILDRCDSIIMVAPAIFLFLYKIGIMIAG
ncbi:MAG: phosphatidate cytidylyltransferase [Oscillospiraceae bacterium]